MIGCFAISIIYGIFLIVLSIFMSPTIGAFCIPIWIVVFLFDLDSYKFEMWLKGKGKY